jgi:hypothetical protein
MDSNRPRRRRDRPESLLTEPTLAADSEYHRKGSTSRVPSAAGRTKCDGQSPWFTAL